MAGLVDGKIALVTGAASGIGRESALLFAREGARVLVSDIDVQGGEETCRLIEGKGGEACFQQANVCEEPEVVALVERCLERFGGLDCAHNNAGTSGGMGLVQEIDLEAWQQTIRVNLTGVFLCMKHEIPVMIERGGGAIVNTASGSGIIATPGLSPYAASKHGVLGLTKTAAVENANSGVRINAVLPGSTDTPMLRAAMAADPNAEKMILASLPGGRFGQPEEVAEATVWLCSDRASFVSGDSMLIDGASVAR